MERLHSEAIIPAGPAAVPSPAQTPSLPMSEEELLWRQEAVSILSSVMLLLTGDGGDMDRSGAVWASASGLRIQQKGSLRPSVGDYFIPWSEVAGIDEGHRGVVATIRRQNRSPIELGQRHLPLLGDRGAHRAERYARLMRAWDRYSGGE